MMARSKMFQLVFQDVPSFRAVFAPKMAVTGRMDMLLATLPGNAASLGRMDVILERIVPTSVPTCSNFDLGVSTVRQFAVFSRFSVFEKIYADFARIKCNLMLFQLFQVLLQRKVYGDAACRSIVCRYRQLELGTFQKVTVVRLPPAPLVAINVRYSAHPTPFGDCKAVSGTCGR